MPDWAQLFLDGAWSGPIGRGSRPLAGAANRRLFAAVAAGAVLLAPGAKGQATYADPYAIILYSGGIGIAGDAGGANPTFTNPGAMAIDLSGNLFVIEGPEDIIRKVSKDRSASILAGSRSQAGSADGDGANARFNFGTSSPCQPAVDGSGNLIVPDTLNGTIRKVTPDGHVTTLAGKVGAGNDVDGPLAVATFSTPRAVAVDSQGNIYVGEMDVVRKISVSGDVTTLAGHLPVSSSLPGIRDGVGAGATIEDVTAMAVDPNGILYVSEPNDVRAIFPDGTVTTVAGQYGINAFADGPGSQARFGYITEIACDALGYVYAADANNNKIRRIDPTGQTSTLAGPPGENPFVAAYSDGTGENARFGGPGGIAVDGAEKLYISDSLNDVIRLGAPTVAVPLPPVGPARPTPPPSSAAPAILTQPASATANLGGSTVFWVLVGNGPASYQWSFQGSPIAGANSPLLELDGLVASQAGDYSVTATNSSGSVTSTQASLSFNSASVASGGRPPSATAYLAGFDGASLAEGATAVVRLVSTTATGYQWFLGNSPIAGANGPTLMIRNIALADSGQYSCLLSNMYGAGFFGPFPFQIGVTATANPGRLTNISCRTNVGTGASQLIMGFATGGAGTAGTEPYLIRASGPALSQFGVTGVLPDPLVTLNGPSGVLATNFKWSGNAAVEAAASSLGAFSWPDPNSSDSALLEPLGGAAYTAQVAGSASDTGIALAEVYDYPAGAYSAAEPRLINISSRSQVGTGGNILIAGFVIGGTTSMTVLIRASGPGLAQFGVSGVLPDPALNLYRSGANGSSALVESNVGWQNDPLIASTAATVGAFSWGTLPTNDSALLVTLAPGAYTAQVSGATGDTGVALVEVYEVR